MRFFSVSLAILVTGYLIVGTFQYNKVRSEVVGLIKNEIAMDIATSQILSAEKKINMVKELGFKNLSIRLEDQESLEEISFLYLEQNLLVDSFIVGKIVDSPSIITFINFVFGSSYLSVTFFIFLIFIVLYVIKVNKLQYEVKEKSLIMSLAQQVAHDIRSPLSVINMLAPTLVRDASIEKCDLIVQAAKRIDGIAEDLLQSQKSPNLKTSAIDVEFLREIVAEKKSILSLKSIGIAIDCDIASHSMLYTKISKTECCRIVSNLIDNSIDALDQKNNGYIKLQLINSKNTSTLMIQDNGCGIEKSKLPFLGVKGKSFFKKSGNGLGLYYVKSLVEKNGGSFTIESILGAGTTVKIVF